jgi:hypothetical protein
MSLQDSFDAFSSSVTNLSGAVKTIADKVKDTRDNTYNKTEVDTALDGKVDNTTFDDTVTNINTSLGLKADASAVFTKDEATAANTAVLESLADTIGSLASAQGQINSGTGQVFASIPLTPTVMPFSVVHASSNVDVFDFDDANNTITFKKEGNYTFTSNVSIRSTAIAPRTLTFTLVNTADDEVLSTESGSFDVPSGSTQTIPMSTLLNVTAGQLPLTVQIKAMASADSYSLEGFSSTLVSSVKVTLTPDSVVGLPTALAAKADKATTLVGYGITDAVPVEHTAASLPTGTTEQRPVSPAVGMIRANTTTHDFEGYINGEWGSIGGGAAGSGGEKVFVLTDSVMNHDYTIPTGKNAIINGNTVINADVTIPDGSSLTFVGGDEVSRSEVNSMINSAISAQHIESGTYLPTFTAVANVLQTAINTPNPSNTRWNYLRVGNIVTVFGMVNVAPTAATTKVEFKATLPPNLPAVNSTGAGVCNIMSTSADYSTAGAIGLQDSTTTMHITYKPAQTTNRTVAINFSYVLS